MPVPTDRDSLIDYCMRNLGFPVVQINVDDDQIQDRIDEALQYYRDYHYDAIEQMYGVHVLTVDDINNKYLTIDPLIIGVVRIFPLDSTINNSYMFDLRYQLRLNELYDFTSTSYVHYTLTMQHLRTLEMLFVGMPPIRYQRHQHQLFIDWGWGTKVVPGDTVILEGYRIIDPDLYPDVWNDMFLKKYSTALIKRQWGENLKKLGNVMLPGGVILNGQKIWDEARSEIKQLESSMLSTYGGPLEFFVG